MKLFFRILADITLILAAMILTFWIINLFNPFMEFLDNEITYGLLLLFSITSAGTALALLWQLTKK